jgi:restriction system protein
VTIPGFQDLMRPVLQECAAADELRTTELVERMAAKFQLTPAERLQLLPSGRQSVIANRTHWALAYLSRTGLLERTRRAHYRLTDRGRDALAQHAGRIDLKFLARFPELASFRGDKGDEPSAIVADEQRATPDEVMRAAHAAVDAALRQQLLDRVLASGPQFFERLIVGLLVAMGMGGGMGSAARAIGGSGDGGLDGVVDQDPLGLDRVYLQAKRYGRDNAVGPNAIRDFFGSLDIAKAGKGVFVTTSSFTKAARETAERLGKRIVLIDGEQLAALMIRYDVGVRIEETFHIKKIDEDFFLE